MSVSVGPTVAGVALIGTAVVMLRSSLFVQLMNLFRAPWTSRRLDEESDFIRFHSSSTALGLAFFGVLLILWGVGID